MRIRGGRVLGAGVDAVRDVWVEDGTIVLPGGSGFEEVDASGCFVCPGFVDLHATLADFAEDGRAAVGGGFTEVVLDPRCGPCDTPHRVRDLAVRSKASPCRVTLAAALTRGLAGQELADVGRMLAAGCEVVSQGPDLVSSSRVLRDALAYAARLGRVVFLRAGDAELEASGVVQYGADSIRMGLRGVPAEVEEMGLARIAALVRHTGARVHVTHLWTAGGVAALRRYRAEGLALTGSTTVDQLVVAPASIAISGYSGRFRLWPPPCSASDRAALLQGLSDGTLVAVATDHRPLAPKDKDCPFEEAVPGAVGLGTAWSLLRELGEPDQWQRWLASGPASVLGRSAPSLEVGAPADLVVLDPNEAWNVSRETLQTQANTPHLTKVLRGRTRLVLVGGDTVHRSR